MNRFRLGVLAALAEAVARCTFFSTSDDEPPDTAAAEALNLLNARR